MKDRRKRQNGKMVPWIATRYARHYRRRAFVTRGHLSGIYAAGRQRVAVLQQMQATGPHEQAAKACAIAKAVLNTHIAANTFLAMSPMCYNPRVGHV